MNDIKKFIKITMTVLLLVIATIAYIQHPKFGKSPARMSIDSNQMIEDLAEIGKLSFLKKNQDDKSENKEDTKS